MNQVNLLWDKFYQRFPGRSLYVLALRLEDGELLIIISNDSPFVQFNPISLERRPLYYSTFRLL